MLTRRAILQHVLMEIRKLCWALQGITCFSTHKKNPQRIILGVPIRSTELFSTLFWFSGTNRQQAEVGAVLHLLANLQSKRLAGGAFSSWIARYFSCWWSPKKEMSIEFTYKYYSKWMSCVPSVYRMCKQANDTFPIWQLQFCCTQVTEDVVLLLMWV